MSRGLLVGLVDHAAAAGWLAAELGAGRVRAEAERADAQGFGIIAGTLHRLADDLDPGPASTNEEEQ